MTTIEAGGTSQRARRAERAIVTASIGVQSPSRSDSIRDVTRLHERVVQRARELKESGAATWFDAGPISTYDWINGNERVSNTTATVQVRLRDLDRVSEVVTELAVEGITTNVTWELTDQTQRQVQSEARRDAVGAARAAAEDYAAALGAGISQVLSISDQARGGDFSPRFARAAMFDAGPAEVTVPDIEVTATVVGTYATKS